MRDLMTQAGFGDIRIQVKENAADVIKEWIPGSGAENFITSAYITAVKPASGVATRDNVRGAATVQVLLPEMPSAGGGCCQPGA